MSLFKIDEEPFKTRFKVVCTNKRASQFYKIFEDLNIEFVNIEEESSNEKFLSKLNGCHGIICNTRCFKFDSKTLDAAGSQLKVISTSTSGHENIDIVECGARNISVGYLPSVYIDSVSEFTIGMLLNISRNINFAIDLGKKMKWSDITMKPTVTGKRLKGTTVGIFGLGTLGMAVAKKLSGFEVKKVIYHNRNVREEATQLNYEYVSFEELLQQSDFLICTCSANKDNLDKFNLDAFKKMKPDSIFINVARGHIVNHDDLYQALSTNIIGAAALDVTKPEPLPSDHGLYTLQNCIITPHISWDDQISRNQNVYFAILNLIRGLKGEPIQF